MLYSCHFDKTELKIMIFINFQVYHRNEKNFESSYGLGGRHLKIRDEITARDRERKCCKFTQDL